MAPSSAAASFVTFTVYYRMFSLATVCMWAFDLYKAATIGVSKGKFGNHDSARDSVWDFKWGIIKF